MQEAKISEIFISYQGEGPYLGIKQLFVRFYGCSFNCAYCDTKPAKFSGYTAYGLNDEIKKMKENYHSVSLTGGEPLEQTDFLAGWLPLFRESVKKPVYLETNGVLPGALERVVKYVDVIAMDIKIPSSTGREPRWNEHRKFLEIAKTKDVFVKLVVTWDTTSNDLIKARDIVREINSKIPIIIQPVDAIGRIREPSGEYLSRFRRLLEQGGRNVKVVPQKHKAWGVK